MPYGKILICSDSYRGSRSPRLAATSVFVLDLFYPHASPAGHVFIRKPLLFKSADRETERQDRRSYR